jgi:hypothetical protein
LWLLLFEAIVNWIVLLVSFSACSLLVYRKAAGFLYSATLLKVFIKFKISGGVFRVLLALGLCHLQIGIICQLTFLFLPHLFLVLALSLTKNSRNILNKSGESGNPCLTPDVRGNYFSFSSSV